MSSLFLQKMLAFSEFSSTLPGMHYFATFWKFHQHHLDICSTTCLGSTDCGSLVGGEGWWNGFLWFPQWVVSLQTWVGKTTYLCLGNVTICMSRGTILKTDLVLGMIMILTSKKLLDHQDLDVPYCVHDVLLL